MMKQFVQLQVMMATRKKAQKGQSLAEYGLILALIACFCIAALTFLGGEISNALNTLGGTITGAVGAGVAG